MNFFRAISYVIIIIFSVGYAFADSHDTEQNIIDKAKEINQKIKEKQSKSQANISSEINNEEPLPLNDPFVGDNSLTGGTQVLSDNEDVQINQVSLSKFKLVGVMSSDDDKGFVSLVDQNGEVMTLSLFEELNPGLLLVGINNKEAVFENNQSLLVINFKNQIIERSR